MNVSALYPTNALSRGMLKLTAFVILSFGTVFSASAAYGLLKTFLQAVNNGSAIGVAEGATHIGVTIAFVVLAGSGAYLAKKCYW